MQVIGSDRAGLVRSDEADATRLEPRGAWRAGEAGALDGPLRALRLPAGKPVTVDLSALDTLDTIGAWLLFRTTRDLISAGHEVHLAGVSEDHRILLDQVSEAYAPGEVSLEQHSALIRLLERIGRAVVDFRDQAIRLLGFTGLVVTRLGGMVLRPGRFPVVSLFHHMEQVGLNAVPIIALITFLIGGVLAFLGSDILATFGAKVYVINLISFAFLREFGVLLAAIMVAGRSGSAFTAQIGSMKAREEIDAMRTLGLDPVERLVVPRVIALVIAMPLLTFVGDIMGLFGGGVIAWAGLEMTPWHYIARLEVVTELRHFWVGLIKAPFFAFVIAVIGCHQGLMVEGTAESVGRRTTLSVVQAIFLVIVMDALFAIFFIEIGY